MSEPRKCFWIPAEPHDENGYVPSMVVEGQGGHAPLAGRDEFATPWYWGKTREAAQVIADRENAKLGLSERAVLDIVLSSVAASRLAAGSKSHG